MDRTSRQPDDLNTPRPRQMTAASGVAAALLLLVLGGATALSVDPVRDTYGIKGDEATYVAMALSVAYDGDLTFERRDLERFWSLYQSGPEGIFLKQGTPPRVRLERAWPFLRLDRQRNAAHLYFGKAFIHPLVAAPFVRLAGLNGLLFFNVVLLSLVVLAGYLFLAARGSTAAALLLAAGFVGATVTTTYAVWLTPEIFNFAAVFFGYFFWLYKEVRPRTAGAGDTVRGWSWSDLLAAVLLGLATFSKPTNVLLIAPLVGLAWWRRRVLAGAVVAVVFVAAVAGSFGANALISGEANYQGGERKTFYGHFPFEHQDATFDTTGLAMATDEVDLGEQFEWAVFWPRLMANARYFIVGRHFGLLPYYFPSLVILGLMVRRWRSLLPWQLLTLATCAATVLALLVQLPFSWSGGGGPPGNRYILSVYAPVLFLAPPLRSVLPGVIAWVGGALFIGQALINPFVAAKYPWQTSQRGLLRALPVELTMINDLPIMLNASRSRVPYGPQSQMLLYFLDDHAFLPEPEGIWIAGRARADIIVRTGDPVRHLRVRLQSPIANLVTVHAGGRRSTVALEAGRPVVVLLAAEWVQARVGSSACLLQVEARNGFVPRLTTPGSTDGRFLGVQVQVDLVDGQAAPAA